MLGNGSSTRGSLHCTSLHTKSRSLARAEAAWAGDGGTASRSGPSHGPAGLSTLLSDIGKIWVGQQLGEEVPSDVVPNPTCRLPLGGSFSARRCDSRMSEAQQHRITPALPWRAQ